MLLGVSLNRVYRAREIAKFVIHFSQSKAAKEAEMAAEVAAKAAEKKPEQAGQAEKEDTDELKDREEK